MKKLLLVSVVASVLGACASEQELCQNRAMQNYNYLQRQIASVEKSVSRGYNIKKTKVPYEEKDICQDIVQDSRTGQKYVYTHVCTKVKHRTVDEKIPVNIEAERERLAAMRERLNRERSFAQARLGQCGAI